MKILHVITSLRTGGAEKLMVDLLPRMKSKGHEVALCVFDGVRTPFYDELEGLGIKIYALGVSVYSPMNILKLWRLMKTYDIVHSHNTASQYYVAIAGLFVDCCLFTTEHNTTNRRRGVWWRPIDRWMYSRYKRIICISEETRNNLLCYLCGQCQPNEKYVTIYNGVDVKSYMSEEKESLEKASSYTIIMIGAFRWEKDQKTIIKSLQLLGEKYRLKLVGGGDEYLKKSCMELAQALGVDDRVEFLGVRHDVKDLLKSADVVVQSSHVDGFCLAAVEGMACGRPVVASDIPGLGDIVGGYGVLFPHENEKTLAAVIQKICEDKSYAADVVERCQKRAKMFDISVMVKRYMDVYKYGEVRDNETRKEDLPHYSIAIRTLGIAGEVFERELKSIAKQTVKPRHVMAYVPDECIGKWKNGRFCEEVYVPVKKGMVAQRALPYDGIDSEYVLLLDDDVELAPDCAERLLRAMTKMEADCVGADTYRNQDMSLWQKMYADVTNFVHPHRDKRWAFKIHRNGSFSYLWKSPDMGERILPTQYVAGPCAMWRKEAIKRLHWEDEVWMDEMEFSYMDDTVESYKLYVNGGKMFLLYDSGVKNLNAKTASGHYRSRATMFYTRARLGFCVWWRTIYEVCGQRYRNNRAVSSEDWSVASVVVAYWLKILWLFFVNIFAGIVYMNVKIPYYYLKGIRDGWRYVHSTKYRNIRSYLIYK